MRKLCLLAAFISPLACAQVVNVQSNSLMRLPNTTSTLQLEKLEVADYGTLLIPSNVTELNIDELRLGHEARIAIVPAEQALEVKVKRAELSEGSQITARGAPGTYEKAARAGRNLNLQFQALSAPQLTVDARGGRARRVSSASTAATVKIRAAPMARPATVPMAVTAAMVSQARRVRWCASPYHGISQSS